VGFVIPIFLPDDTSRASFRNTLFVIKTRRCVSLITDLRHKLSDLKGRLEKIRKEKTI